MPAPNTAAEIGREGLLALAARVEAATGADRELDCAIAELIGAKNDFGVPITNGIIGVGLFTALIDHAAKLVPEGFAVDQLSWWPDQPSDVTIFGTHDVDGKRWHCAHDGKWEATAATPALALTAASLRAIAALKAQAVGEGEGS